MTKLQAINVNQNGALQNMNARDAANAQSQLDAYKNAAAGANAAHTSMSIDEQYESHKRAMEEIDHKRRKELAPTNDEMRDYPAIDAAWKEFITIRNLTLGQK